MLIGEDHQGLRLITPEHNDAKNSKAFAYVRPHDLDVQRYVASQNRGEQATGIVAKLTRAVVVGPIARLELVPLDASAAAGDGIIEAQIPARLYQELALQQGETVLLTPRKARVFVA
jgi:sulfate transport system ATP-binding protein